MSVWIVVCMDIFPLPRSIFLAYGLVGRPRPDRWWWSCWKIVHIFPRRDTVGQTASQPAPVESGLFPANCISKTWALNGRPSEIEGIFMPFFLELIFCWVYSGFRFDWMGSSAVEKEEISKPWVKLGFSGCQDTRQSKWARNQMPQIQIILVIFLNW